MKINLINKLSFKLILTVSFVLICILSVYTYLNIKYLDNYLTGMKYETANNISDLIKKSTRYSMLLNRREDVYEIIKTVGTEPGVKGIRVYNKLGRIIVSTDSSEVNKTVDVTAEACNVCHNGTTSLKSLSNTQKIRTFRDRSNHRVLGLINPIQNDVDCYTAECHAHSPKTEMLGVLDVMISLEQHDTMIADNTKRTLLNSLFLLIIISSVSGFFIIVLVNRPIRKLNKGIEELGKGNLNYKITLQSKDEFGKMADRFNEMSSKLSSAYQEIKDWSENLNIKVQEKSEELKNIYNQVIQIEKLASLGKLSATVAHELNNPLEGILTYSKLISKKIRKNGDNEGDAQILSFLDLITDESARCGKIVKDLLLFSHRGEDEMNDESLITIIDKSVTLIHHHLEINKINLVKDYPENDIIVNCDSQKIQQALMSLLINAIEAMPNGGSITVSLSQNEELAVIKIIDEGTGIADKDLPNIFEPFYSTKEASKGTGLGLAVVYGIINNHGGQVVVENTSPHGTTFKITLPIKKNHE
ncbi:MAG: HAMP domain-containing sensor histidine kinase, partial [Ignavibacteriaceae bacterium]|nr:HAMP domain-containing sensor histidine kinase [Ignavibacteriaceae bacterium]